MQNIDLKFVNAAYSEREAWKFLQTYGPRIACSIRGLARLWKWHRSKVERFLKILKLEKIIETEIIRGETVITILANKSLRTIDISFQQDKFETNAKAVTMEISSRDNFEDNSEIVPAQDIQCLEEHHETNLRQFQDDFTLKEEKKKRSKKRKEEIKEKTLLKEGKKEKIFSENVFSNFSCEETFSSESDENEKAVLEEISTKLPVLKRYPEHVTAEDVLDWAEKNLPQNLNIEWELEKFKEYHKLKGKNQMKDAVAFFKGWLKKSIEFNSNNNIKTIGGNNHERFKFSQNRETKTEFERFLAGGYRAVDRIRGSGLDWQACRQV